MPGILSGLRVIEGSAFVAAPLGGMTLAQLGADVIRFDPIGGGLDYGRWPLTNDGTQVSRDTVTNAAGEFNFSAVQPATYTLKATLTGFKTYERKAVRIATRFMTPVFVLSDGCLANSSEPWRIPDLSELPTLAQ